MKPTILQTKSEVAVPSGEAPPPPPPPPPPQMTAVPMVLQVNSTRKYDDFKAQLARKLGIAQIVGAILAIIINSLGLWIHASNENDNEDYYEGYDDDYYFWNVSMGYNAGCAFWGGVFFLLSGSYSICAARDLTRCKINALMVLSIWGALSASIMLGFSLSAVAQDSSRLADDFEYDYDDHERYEYESGYDEEARADAVGSLVLSIMFVLVSVLELVTATWSSTLACRVTCCCVKKTPVVSQITSVMPQSNIIVLDARGRAIPGAQVIQILSPGATGGAFAPPLVAAGLAPTQATTSTLPSYVECTENTG